MRLMFFFLILMFSTTSQAQQSISGQIPDSVLYNPSNYLPAGGLHQSSQTNYEVFYVHRFDSSYKMKEAFLDSAQSKKVSRTFYHQNQLHGPFEAYAMSSLQAKGRYKNGKLDGERITYYNGGSIMEKANYSNGEKSGVWEFYDFQGALKRKLTYNINGTVEKDEQF